MVIGCERICTNVAVLKFRPNLADTGTNDGTKHDFSLRVTGCKRCCTNSALLTLQPSLTDTGTMLLDRTKHGLVLIVNAAVPVFLLLTEAF